MGSDEYGSAANVVLWVLCQSARGGRPSRGFPATVISPTLGRLCEAGIRWARTGITLSRTLYPPCCHLQSSIVVLRRRPGHVPLAGLRAWQQIKNDDGFRRRVHPPLPPPRAAERFCPHPTFRFHGERTTFRIHGTLSSFVRNGVDRSSRGSPCERLGRVMSRLSDPDEGHREADRCADRMELHFHMLCRYVVAEIPVTHFPDVLAHAAAHVCLDLKNASKSSLDPHRRLSKTAAPEPTLLVATPPLALVESRPVTISTRIPVLSP